LDPSWFSCYNRKSTSPERQKAWYTRKAWTLQCKTRFYAAWHRGSNENSNGLLREFSPKKTDLAKVTLDILTEALVLINKVHWYGFYS